jgi:two-component system chemotaxis response regulator CheY
MKCLIVEDNEFLRTQTEFFLDGLAEIATAGNGREAVDLFTNALAERNPFDLVLLDVMMPEMDGQQALKLMRQAEKQSGGAAKKAVIIMTTALSSVDAMQEALLEGDCTDYLVKPVRRDDLVALLNRNGLI